MNRYYCTIERGSLNGQGITRLVVAGVGDTKDLCFIVPREYDSTELTMLESRLEGCEPSEIAQAVREWQAFVG